MNNCGVDSCHFLLPSYCRDVSEPLEKTLIRISRNFQKKEKKKKKGGSSPSKKFSHENATAGAGVGVGVSGVWLRRADGCLAYDLSELTNSHWETGMSVHIKEDLSLTGLAYSVCISFFLIFVHCRHYTQYKTTLHFILLQ